MRIARIRDIDITVSKLLILLIGLVFLTGNILEFAAVFLILFIHESAHVVMARWLKLHVSEIELLPFGGMVKIESAIELNPSHEILIAASGPAANLLLLLGYFLLIYIGAVAEGAISLFFINANLLLAGFNLLPALPLDGGRILRSILSREMGMKKATAIASGGGLVLALFLVMTGLYAVYYRVINYSLFLMAGFLVYSAVKERRTATYVMMRDISRKKEMLQKDGSLPARELVVLARMPLKHVLNRFVPQRYHYVRVIDEQMGELGVLSESQLVRGMMEYGINLPVGQLTGRLGGTKLSQK